MNSAAADIVKCSRCHQTGHFAKDCALPFARTFTIAEMRAKRQVEAAQKTTAREARQAEFVKAREARQAERDTRRASRQLYKAAKPAPEWDTKSDTSEATVSTKASTVTFTSEEVRCMASKDKEVRKLEKVLREIVKLEERQDLDVLQKAKVARKAEFEDELQRVRGLAEARARNELRQQNPQLA